MIHTGAYLCYCSMQFKPYYILHITDDYIYHYCFSIVFVILISRTIIIVWDERLSDEWTKFYSKLFICEAKEKLLVTLCLTLIAQTTWHESNVENCLTIV